MCTHKHTFNVCVHDESHQRLALMAIQKQWLSVHLLCAHHSNTVRCNIKNANKDHLQFDSCNFLVCVCVRLCCTFSMRAVQTAMRCINMFMSYNIITIRLDMRLLLAGKSLLYLATKALDADYYSMLTTESFACTPCLMPHTNYERWWYLVQNAHRACSLDEQWWKRNMWDRAIRMDLIDASITRSPLEMF